jgi:hypothetical protein
MGVGGPYAWRQSNTDPNSSPYNGDVCYHPDIDEWFVPFPNSSASYVPALPSDTAHWDVTGKGKIVSYFDGTSGYWNNKLFGFGSYSIGVGALRYRDMATGNVTVLTNDVPISPNSWPRAYTQGGVDTNGQAWQFQANWDYCTWDFGSPTNSKWAHHVITNPPAIPPLTGMTFTDSGAISVLDPVHNRIVVWCGQNQPSSGWPGMVAVQKTWVIDRATLICSQVATSGPVPPAVSAVGYGIFFNPGRGKVQMLADGPNHCAQIWELTY